MIVFSLFAFSCSNSSVEKSPSEEFSTLKEETDSLNSKIRWTDEIEQGRLTGKVKTERLGSKVKASVLSVSAKKDEDSPFIYPAISGFGSLDTTLIPLNLKAKIEEFCGSFSKNGDLSSVTRKESAYNLALFYYDLAFCLPAYGDFFKAETLSAESDVSVQENQEKNETGPETESDENAEPQVPEKKFFDFYKLGEPFIDGVNYEIPVLFGFDGRILTLETYWTLENSQWMLDQIQISSLEDAKTES